MCPMILTCASALWLGILTSLSPCPLATNIAAISYLSKRVSNVKNVAYGGIAYTLGRVAAYALVGFIIITSLLSVPAVAQFLQRYMNKALGPILVIAGLVLLDVIKINIPGLTISSQKQRALAQAGAGGAFMLGFLFALSFCPISAALFFGSLIPLSLNHKFGIILPFIYGIGTGLPVLFFAVLIAFGIGSISKWLNKISRVEKYVIKITGVIFIGVGCYYILTHIFNV